MSQENKDLDQPKQHEFNNSKDTGESFSRLVTEPPVAVIRTIVAKFVALLISIMDKMLESLGIAITEPDKLNENVEMATKRAKLLSRIMLRVLEDPEVRQNVKELAIALNDSALKPFLAVALITLKEMEPAIDEAEKELIERLKEGIRRAGDGAWDAFENVIAGIPGVGNAWSGFSALTSVIQAGQTIVQTNLQLILESTYRILGTLRKVNVPGLEAVDSFIDFGINAYNIYTNVTNKFDEINATMQQLKFEPKEGLTKQKVVENMMPEGLNAVMDPKTDEPKTDEPKTDEPKTDEPKTDEPKTDELPKTDESPKTDELPKTDQPPQKKTPVKKGGTRRKYKRRRKRRTKKRALRKKH